MSNLDKELENALKEKFTEKVSQDEDFLKLFLLYIQKNNPDLEATKPELTELIENIYQNINND